MTDTDYTTMSAQDFSDLESTTRATLDELQTAADRAEARSREAIAAFQAAPDERLAAKKMVAEQVTANAYAALRAAKAAAEGILTEASRRQAAQRRASLLERRDEVRADVRATADRIAGVFVDFRGALEAELGVLYRALAEDAGLCKQLHAEREALTVPRAVDIVSTAIDARFPRTSNMDIHGAHLGIVESHGTVTAKLTSHVDIPSEVRR